jgi:hypothetical protein
MRRKGEEERGERMEERERNREKLINKRKGKMVKNY